MRLHSRRIRIRRIPPADTRTFIRVAIPQASTRDSELIPQSRIQELRELKEQVRKIRARHDRLKAEIIEKLRRGVPVQQGSLNARLITRNYRFLSAKSLLPLFGKAEVQRLKTQIQPTISYLVEIFETD